MKYTCIILRIVISITSSFDKTARDKLGSKFNIAWSPGTADTSHFSLNYKKDVTMQAMDMVVLIQQNKIFDAETPLPDFSLSSRQKIFLGFGNRYRKIRNQLQLVFNKMQQESRVRSFIRRIYLSVALYRPLTHS